MSHEKRILELKELSWPQIDALDRDRTAYFIVVAPLEEHGRHLPVGTDLFEVESWQRTAAEMLADEFPDFSFVLCPSFPVGTSCVPGFPGNFEVSQRTLRAIIEEVVGDIASWGFRHIVVLAGHMAPRHLIVAEEACERVNRRFGEVAISPVGAFVRDMLRRRSKGGFGEHIQRTTEDIEDDVHAGWMETSMMLDLRPDLVDPSYRDLPATHLTTPDMLSPERIRRKVEGLGHIGTPAIASAELGRDANKTSIEWLVQVLGRFLRREGHERYRHGMFWRVLPLRTDFPRWAAGAGTALTVGALALRTLLRRWARDG
ncbi:MAG: creatininase family protein [Armatimonadota bacterium]|nr:MAG: creatininase family protein [Armatimonadota bacterium]